MGMRRPRYAIMSQGVVLGLFATRGEAEKALEMVSDQKNFKVLPMTHREVKLYYRRVNERRKRLGLEPLDPSKW
jgi:hypothetical protein